MTAARHEAGHAVAVHLLDLADVLKPGGAAVTPGGGLMALGQSADMTAEQLSALAARVEDYQADTRKPILCLVAIEAARARPDLGPAILTFMLSGCAVECREWRGDFSRTITVRTSSDFRTARQMILDLFDFTGLAAESMASEIAFDALERAVEWTSQSNVQELIEAVAAYLAEHHAATWAELQTIFSSHTESVRGETLTPPVCVSSESPLAGTKLETVADIAQSATVGNSAPNSNEQTRNEDTQNK